MGRGALVRDPINQKVFKQKLRMQNETENAGGKGNNKDPRLYF